MPVMFDQLFSAASDFWYKKSTGLRRFRASLSQCGKTASGVGLGGVDVVIGGDSILEGYSSTSYLYDRMTHRLKVLLQDALNPVGVLGGYGFVPIFQGNTAKTMVWTSESTATFDNTFGYGTRRLSCTAGQRSRFAFNGTLDDFFRLGVSDLQFAAARDSAQSTVNWDINSANAYVTVGSGNVASGSDTNVGLSPTDFGYRSVRITGLTPTNLNVLQIAPVASGQFSGAFAYNGDYDCGIRIHNVANAGHSAATISAIGGGLECGIDEFGTATGMGATNAKLFIYNFIANDVGSGASPAVTAAAFKASYQTVISQCLGLASKPSILLVIPPCRTEANSFANYQGHVDMIYELADENDHVAIVDFWKLCENSQYSEVATDLGWDSDGVHFSDICQEAWAQIIFGGLTSVQDTLLATSSSSGVATLLTRITGLTQTKSEADTNQTNVLSAVNDVSVAVAAVGILNGPGTVLYTRRVTTGSAPIQGVEAWVTTDSAGSNVIAGTLYTDSSGDVSFRLDPGNYYIWLAKAGFNFTNPNPFTVASP